MFDVVIVDEAQDVLKEPYLDVLDVSLRGGLAAGTWRFFSDYTKQSIYGTDCIPLDEFLEKRASAAAIYTLTTNCRNTPRIASYVSLLGGLRPPYARVLRADDGIEPDLRFFASEEEQHELLCDVLEALRGEGYRGQDTVVLSPKGSSACASQVQTLPWRDRLRQLGTEKAGHIGYTSIHAFKGMEAAAVVVTDVESLKGEAAQNLFYVAITRATDRLIVLVSESARAKATEIVLAGPGGTS